jgi:hypothetical protein
MLIPDDMMFLAAILAAEEKFEKDDKRQKQYNHNTKTKMERVKSRNKKSR